jgi:hypothetical protein
MTPCHAPRQATLGISLYIKSYFAASVAYLFEFDLVTRACFSDEWSVVYVVYINDELLCRWQCYFEPAVVEVRRSISRALII